MKPWIERAAIAATQLRTFSVSSAGRRTLVRISTAWQGGFTGTSYITDVVWELDEQGHIAAKVAFDNAAIAVAATNARQLDNYFRGSVYALLRNVMDTGGR